MMFENIFEDTKKNILKIKLISSIILSFLKLRDLHYSIDSNNIIDRVCRIKNMSNLFYNIMSFNVFSILFIFANCYNKIKNKYKSYINKK
jgi:hypothetical protein